MKKQTGNYQMVRSFNDSDYNVGNHPVTLEMANEYYEWMEGRRRYLSFKDTITMGQLQQLRLLYQHKKDFGPFEDNEEPEEPVEKKFRQDQVFRPFPKFNQPIFKPGKNTKTPRTTKWERTRRYGTLQIKIRELK